VNGRRHRVHQGGIVLNRERERLEIHEIPIHHRERTEESCDDGELVRIGLHRGRQHRGAVRRSRRGIVYRSQSARLLIGVSVCTMMGQPCFT